MQDAIHWLWQGARRTGARRDGAAAALADAPDVPAFRVLVVDDLPVHRLLLSGMLKVLFPLAVVDEADDGLQAQALLRGKSYDIVLSDWQMPNMDGLQLASWLRSSERLQPSEPFSARDSWKRPMLHSTRCSQQPFVLVSSRDGVDEIAPLFSTHGIDGYLIKPFDQAAIREIVRFAIGVSEPIA
jgi:two-component system chemotaxis response regulator CheY